MSEGSAPSPGPSRRGLLKTLALSGGASLGGAAAINAIAPLAFPEDRTIPPNNSYWSAALPPPNPPLGADLEADVVIIGGGFTGLSSAYYLTQAMPKKRIVVLEARRCGNGASGRNGAMVLNLKHRAQDPALAGRLYQLTVGNVRDIQALSVKMGVDCELEQNGALTVLRTVSAAERARTASARMVGLPIIFWDRDRVATALGTDVYAGGLFDPGAGQVHPGKLVRLWKAAAEAGGVEIFEGTPVASITEGPAHLLRTASGHTVRAAQLVLATNAYTSRLGYLRGAVAPIYNYVGMTAPLEPAALAKLNWRVRIPFNDDRREVYYAGQTKDGRIHFGGGPVDYGFNNSLQEPAHASERFAGLHREFGRVFPSLADVPFEIRWGGLVDVSLNQEPAVGQIGRHKNIFYAIGYSGEGVNLTSVFGRVIADLAAGRRELWTWLPFLDRLPPYIPNEPFRWMAVQGNLGLVRMTADA